ncbi:hypothetical protein ACN47E_006375 [Coniothyrium glycines]
MAFSSSSTSSSSSTVTVTPRTSFLKNNLDILTRCSICLEGFDAEQHAPTRLTGAESCHHVFGLGCITRWVGSGEGNSDKCPICRRVLFAGVGSGEGEGEGEEEEEEEDSDDEGDESSEGSVWEEEEEEEEEQVELEVELEMEQVGVVFKDGNLLGEYLVWGAVEAQEDVEVQVEWGWGWELEDADEEVLAMVLVQGLLCLAALK